MGGATQLEGFVIGLFGTRRSLRSEVSILIRREWRTTYFIYTNYSYNTFYYFQKKFYLKIAHN